MQSLANLGGKLEAIYFTLGERDVLVLCACPDNASVASLGLAASASGLVRTKITPLLTGRRVGPNDCQRRRLPAAGHLMDWCGQYAQRFESFCPFTFGDPLLSHSQQRSQPMAT
jgi:hypothetical protein